MTQFNHDDVINAEYEEKHTSVPPHTPKKKKSFKGFGNLILTAQGLQNVCGPELYSDEPPQQKPVTLTAIPYYTWGNRGLNQMLVWIPE